MRLPEDQGTVDYRRSDGAADLVSAVTVEVSRTYTNSPPIPDKFWFSDDAVGK